MNNSDRQFLTLDDALHMHQTGTVGSGDIFGPGFHMMPYFITAHTDRDRLLFDGKHTAETATFVYMTRFKNFNTIDQLKQVAQFIKIRDIQFARSRQEKFTYAMTAIVDAHFMRKTGFQPFWLYHIMNKIAEIINLTGTFAQMSFLGKDARMIQFDKCHTTTRRPNNVIILLEQIIEP